MSDVSSSGSTTTSVADIARDAVSRQPNAFTTTSPYAKFGRAGASGLSFGKTSSFDRMVTSSVGTAALGIVGNEGRTLGILDAIGTDLLLEMLALQGQLGAGAARHEGVPGKPDGIRAVIVPAAPPAGAALVFLDPARAVGAAEAVTSGVGLDTGALSEAAARVIFGAAEVVHGDAGKVREFLISQGPDGLAETLWISQPDIVVMRRPSMIPLCAPWPCLTVRAGAQTSTAGILCRDPAGQLGVTACYHGTGPVGTPVQVELHNSSVTIANNIQDTVFVPLPAGYNLPQLRGQGGVLRGRAPGYYDQVEFHGASSGARQTHITSYDPGILRQRPTLQLRVQTGPDTNTGDSGSALLNQDDKVVGFAFERSAFGEIPEMTDWIWAANAFSALGLRPM